MTYSETLEYLYTRLPMFQRQGAAAYKANLDNTIALCEAVGNPQHKFKSVHIAGTNGKGSTSSMLAAVFQCAGYKTGLYTSPHLKSFTERISINGAEISEAAVIDFTSTYKTDIERISPSFFEVCVAMAFDFFAKEKVDIAIIEVGLGGRLDSTNVILPELSVITNISYDHTDLLGDTLAKIAYEKAGIIKANIPVVIGETHTETEAVFREKAQIENATIIFADKQRKASIIYQDIWQQKISVSPENQIFTLDLPGNYQQHNLLTVLQAIDNLKEDWKITDLHIQQALCQVKKLTGLRGRMFCLQSEPIVICDTGHNEAGIKEVIPQIQSFCKGKLHIVWGMVKDKNHAPVLTLLPQDAIYYFVAPDLPRALSAADMQAKSADFQLFGEKYDSVKAGLSAALTAAATDDLIFVGGSTFVVAEVV